MPLFIEKEEYEFFLRSVKFCDQIDKYAAMLGLDPIEVDNYKNENELFNYVFAHKAAYGSLAESFMRYKICNMQMQYSDLAWQCKSSRNYTTKIGDELGITTTFSTLPNMNDTPIVTISFSLEGYPVLKWDGGQFESVEIWKDSGHGKGYEKLGRSNNSEYVDKTPLTPNKCEVWKYSAIYLFKDEMVGNWSDECEAIVHYPSA